MGSCLSKGKRAGAEGEVSAEGKGSASAKKEAASTKEAASASPQVQTDTQVVEVTSVTDDGAVKTTTGGVEAVAHVVKNTGGNDDGEKKHAPAVVSFATDAEGGGEKEQEAKDVPAEMVSGVVAAESLGAGDGTVGVSLSLKDSAPFVLMENTRRALRTGLDECAVLVKADNMFAFQAAYAEVTRAFRQHMCMEEDGFFAYMENVADPVALDVHALTQLHEEYNALEQRMDAAIRAGNAKETQKACAEWIEKSVQLIDREDDISAECAESAQKKNWEQGALERKMNEQVVSPNMHDMHWFAAWNCAMLAQHVSFEEMKNWACAMQAVAAPQQWTTLVQAIREPLPEDYFAKLIREWHIEQPASIWPRE